MSDVRARIVEAALGLMRSGGIKRLSQVQVARLSGVPQGHLTYYFPKKSDLVAELMRRFSDDAVTQLTAIVQAGGGDARQRGFELIQRLAHDRERTRMLVGLLVESEQQPELRAALGDNTRHALSGLAFLLGRSPDDPNVELTLCTLWGIGLMHLAFEGLRDDSHTDRLLAALQASLSPARVTRRAGPKRNPPRKRSKR